MTNTEIYLYSIQGRYLWKCLIHTHRFVFLPVLGNHGYWRVILTSTSGVISGSLFWLVHWASENVDHSVEWNNHSQKYLVSTVSWSCIKKNPVPRNSGTQAFCVKISRFEKGKQGKEHKTFESRNGRQSAKRKRTQ